MTSILNEITRLRKGAALVIDYKNSNRYRVVAIEPNGSKTAYYFSAPIYNAKTRKAVEMKFHNNGGTVYTTGSNANITITDTVRMDNPEGSCVISLTLRPARISDYEVSCGRERLYPTTNGVAISCACPDGEPYTFSVEISKPFPEVRANDKYIAFMSERFRPFFAVSCIGTADAGGNIISPAKVSYQKSTDRTYTVSVIPCSAVGKSVIFEANLYESKLFQDTTVESKNPKTNNAFGSVGFIGTTKEYGEQWLYSRPDFSKMSELNDKKILRAVLHLPRLSRGAVELSACKVSARFCSFGSTWDNKIAEAAALADSQFTDQYIDLDVMAVLSDKRGHFTGSDGFILKAKKKNAGFSVIATGDSYLTPQILEITYK